VTTGILPIVEQYGKHSEAVWEGSKFWKQFFEASANVSLSGYEAPEQDESITQDDTQQSQLYEDETEEGDDTVTGTTATPPRPSSAQGDVESTLSFNSPSLGHSTPRAPPSVRGAEGGV
jgi:DASH complex subunit ASK1